MNKSQYEAILKTCSDKINGDNDLDWKEIVEKYGLDIHYDTLRKASQTVFGGAFVRSYFEDKGFAAADNSTIDEKIKELRKERMKLQTVNVERNRLDRNEARQELYYEQIGSLCQTLPVPEFNPLYVENTNSQCTMSYVVALSDQHYGATFESERNSYSPDEFKSRLEDLTGQLLEFITKKKLNKIIITSLGDSIQGILRYSDLLINDTAIVRAVVDYSRLIAQFLNTISRFAEVVYYHVPTANHTQIRPLNSKASELGAEDLEYVIGNYIKDLLSSNERITVNLADEGKQYIKIEDIMGFNVYALHGHQIKNTDAAIKDLQTLTNCNVDYVLMGHFHGGKETTVSEGVTYDCEVLIAPSFIGSDPYSDSLMTGSKGAVKIWGFDELSGHTESYKFILN